jgi:microcystin degradation protein MlrC
MNRFLFKSAVIAVVALVAVSCGGKKKLPKIAIAGIKIESSTFSPARSGEDAFNVAIGDEIYDMIPYLNDGQPLRERAQWVPALVARATPGGAVTKEVYEKFVGIILDSLRANLPLDGLVYDIHGAMSVVGMDDPEGDMLKRIREVIGNDVVVTTPMDLHGNVSWDLALNSDMISCYRMAPHEDAWECRERAARILIERLESGKGKPAHKVWIPVPILLPGEQTSTRVEPAKSLYAMTYPASEVEGVIDASIWIGYAWADEPRNHAVVMATGDNRENVVKVAEEIAGYFWNVRHQFDFVAPTTTLEECLANALKKDAKRPYYISDTGDNPTAGGAGDVTWTLTQLLGMKEFSNANGLQVIYASLPDKDFVAKAKEVGVGGRIDMVAGAEVDDRYAPPVRLKGTVTAIYDHPVNSEVAVKVGSIDVIVTEIRKGFHKEHEFTKLGLNPRTADIVMVKIGYLEPELYNMQADWMMALTLGGVNQDLPGLPYKRINRPMYPLDKDMPDPDLSAREVPFVKQ